MLSYVEHLPKWATPHQHGRSNRYIIAAVCTFFLFSWLSYFHQSIRHLSTSLSPDNPISNATLGFEKIYALALQGREDRTQPLLDAANATNLTLTVLNAVRDTDIDQVDYPKAWNAENHRGGELGCLASHVRTWNLMVASNISSALILESDADWDLRIRDSMQPLATGVRTLVDWPFTIEHQNVDPQIFPYGDSWDIIWIGHCGSNHAGNVRAYAWNDTSVPPKDREYWFDLGLLDEQYVPGTRSIFQFGRTTCSSGYAISNQGAKKLVDYFTETDENLDLKLSAVCSSRVDMTCLGVWPQLITAVDSKSNIDHGDNSDETSPNPKNQKIQPGPAIQYSARVNAKQIMQAASGYVPQRDWLGEWDTCWGVNPTKNGTWEMMKINQTSGEPVFQTKKGGEEEGEEERKESSSRIRRALRQG